MKKILLITMSILLAACGVVQPVQQEQPTPVIQTVVVTVIAPTEIVPPTAVPTEIPPTAVPTETLVPTLPPQPTEALPTVDPAAGNSGGLVPVNVDNNLGKGVFTSITFSSDVVTLRCNPREMQITITPNLQDITDAVLYYRVVDNPAALYPSEWQNLGEMQEDSNGNFVFTFKGETIHPDFRVLDKAWVDFQFIGINKGGGVVDRTQKIERLVTYYKDCP